MQGKSRAARPCHIRSRSNPDLLVYCNSSKDSCNEALPAAAINLFYREGDQRKVATTPGLRMAEA